MNIEAKTNKKKNLIKAVVFFLEIGRITYETCAIAF